MLYEYEYIEYLMREKQMWKTHYCIHTNENKNTKKNIDRNKNCCFVYEKFKINCLFY